MSIIWTRRGVWELEAYLAVHIRNSGMYWSLLGCHVPSTPDFTLRIPFEDITISSSRIDNNNPQQDLGLLNCLLCYARKGSKPVAISLRVLLPREVW